VRNALRALAAALLACAACSCTEEPAARPADAAAAGGGGAADAAFDTPASGGGAGTGDSGADSGGLITDPITGQAIWRPVEPPLGPCEVYVADVDPDPFPKRVWSDCGTGAAAGLVGAQRHRDHRCAVTRPQPEGCAGQRQRATMTASA